MKEVREKMNIKDEDKDQPRQYQIRDHDDHRILEEFRYRDDAITWAKRLSRNTGKPYVVTFAIGTVIPPQEPDATFISATQRD
jgi:hypothetical protein